MKRKKTRIPIRPPGKYRSLADIRERLPVAPEESSYRESGIRKRIDAAQVLARHYFRLARSCEDFVIRERQRLIDSQLGIDEDYALDDSHEE